MKPLHKSHEPEMMDHHSVWGFLKLLSLINTAIIYLCLAVSRISAVLRSDINDFNLGRWCSIWTLMQVFAVFPFLMWFFNLLLFNSLQSTAVPFLILEQIRTSLQQWQRISSALMRFLLSSCSEVFSTRPCRDGSGGCSDIAGWNLSTSRFRPCNVWFEWFLFHWLFNSSCPSNQS